MKRIILPLLLCLLLSSVAQAQFVADLTGFPLVTTGWNIGGFGTIVDSTVRLTSPSTNQNGYVYYNTPVNLTGCGQFTVDFDYRIQVSSASTVADGIAFWYISNPPSGFVTGGGIGLPSFANGLIMIMDTYDNTAPVNVPLATILGYDGSIAGYTEGSGAGLLGGGVAPLLTYITDGTWRHCKITYNVGNINVYFNYSPVPTLTGFYPLTISGYFGFSSSTGAAYSTQSVKSVHITALVSLPTPTVVSPITYCQDDVAIALTATPDPGATIQWFSTDTGTVVPLPTAPVPNTSVPGTFKFYVRQTAGTCISPPDSVTVIVNPTPDPPSIDAVTEYCQNEPFVPFTVTGSSLLWYTTTTGGVGTATAPTVPTAVPGTYKHYVTQTVLGCESNRDSVTVEVHPTPPNPTMTSGQLIYCQYETFAPFVIAGTNIRWYTVATGGVPAFTAPVINTAIAGTYDYYVSQTDIHNCESGRLHLHVVVSAKPPAPAVTPISHCQYSLAPPLIAGGTGLTWYGPGVTPGSPVAPTPSTALTGTTTYYVTQTISGCIGDSAALVVTIDSTPVTPSAFSNSPVCEGDTLYLNATTATDGVSWTWDGPNTFTSANANTFLFPVTLPADGFYTVTATLGLCSSTSIIPVTITPRPTVDITSNSPVCSGSNDTLQLQATGAPGTVFTWSGPYTFISNAQNPFRTPVVSEYAGVYHVNVLYNGCTNSASHTVVVNPTPVPPWIKWLTFCQYYDAPNLQAEGSNIRWYTSSTPGTAGSSIPPKPQTDIVGYSFYYVNQTVAGCPSMIDSIRVTITPKPQVTVTPLDSTVCPHDSIVMTATNPDDLAYYKWYPTMYLDAHSGPVVVAHPETDIDYAVVTTNQYNCTDTGIVSVKVKSAAVIHLEDSITLFPGETYKIEPQTNCTAFSWSPSGGLSGKYLSNPTASPIINTKYVVTGMTEWGCRTKDSININLAEDAVISVPNAFSPGSVNSIFRPIRRGTAKLLTFRVYDRWGVVVYEGKDIDAGWDGTFKGVPQPVGVYVYEISAVTTNGRIYNKQGNVTLLR